MLAVPVEKYAPSPWVMVYWLSSAIGNDERESTLNLGFLKGAFLGGFQAPGRQIWMGLFNTKVKAKCLQKIDKTRLIYI